MLRVDSLSCVLVDGVPLHQQEGDSSILKPEMRAS